MHPIYIVLIIVTSLIILFFLTTYLCFRLAFYVPEKDKGSGGELPPGRAYEPYHEKMKGWKEEEKQFKKEDVSIKSFDGLTLVGTYYEFFKDAPIEIMFHGYRGSAERDLCGGIQRCLVLKRNVLRVDQRARGRSGGNVITFGIKERFDVKAWTEYAYDRFGKEVKLLITGISMGASSVIMASSLSLPETVVGVVADCGYSSAKDIIKTVIKKMHLPSWLFYPLVKLGAKIFGKFDLEETSPEEEVKKSKLPIVFIHGDNDDFVPKEMSQINYRACATIKAIEIFEGAAHGASFLVDEERYIRVLKDFEKKYS